MHAFDSQVALTKQSRLGNQAAFLLSFLLLTETIAGSF
jgi:hypothetical protein